MLQALYLKLSQHPDELMVFSSGSVEHCVRPMWLREGDTAKSTSPTGVDFGQKPQPAPLGSPVMSAKQG